MKGFKKAQSQFATKQQAKRQDILYWSAFFWLTCKYAFRKGQKQETLSRKELYDLKNLHGNVKHFVWFNKKGSSSLVEISKEKASELFPNYVIFYKENGNLRKRCWWHCIDGRYHQFPEATQYFVRKIW